VRHRGIGKQQLPQLVLVGCRQDLREQPEAVIEIEEYPPGIESEAVYFLQAGKRRFFAKYVPALVPVRSAPAACRSHPHQCRNATSDHGLDYEYTPANLSGSVRSPRKMWQTVP
jgi:hypothetical protein